MNWQKVLSYMWLSAIVVIATLIIFHLPASAFVGIGVLAGAVSAIFLTILAIDRVTE